MVYPCYLLLFDCRMGFSDRRGFVVSHRNRTWRLFVVHVSNFKPRRIRDKAHLRFIRKLCCANCGISKPVEAAHIRYGSNSGIGIKPSDDRTIPLCTVCHFKQHTIGEPKFWGQRLGAAIQLSGELYAHTGEAYECLSLIAKFMSSRQTPT